MGKQNYKQIICIPQKEEEENSFKKTREEPPLEETGNTSPHMPRGGGGEINFPWSSADQFS
jgi:hypothetical protein